MKIEAVEVIHSGRWLFFQVITDTGISGIGESGLWTFPSAASAMLKYLRPYLLGQDPLKIQHHWQLVNRASHFRGSSVAAATAAIDIALWDIAGKYFGVPVYRLLGGPVRQTVRVYNHILGETPDELAQAARLSVADGFDALRFDPFRPRWPNVSHARFADEAVANVAAVRETVGDDVDLCIECHFKLTRSQAAVVSQALLPLKIFFLEDPVPPESPRLVGEVASSVQVPIATGERLLYLEEFREVLQSGPVAYLRPDLCLTGITQALKIAALAESWRVGIVPHNWLSPVSTAACVQVDAVVPNFVLQEYRGEDSDTGPRRRLVRQPLKREGPSLIVPEAPGIGVELDYEFARSLPPEDAALKFRTQGDGAVVDD